MMKEKQIYEVAEALLIIGGLNWGLAIFNFNLVSFLFQNSLVAQIIYGAVGLSAVWLAWFKWFRK